MSASFAKRTIFDSLVFAYLVCVALAVIFGVDDGALLQLSRNALLFLGAALAGAVVSSLLNKYGLKTLGESIFESPFSKAQAVDQSWYRSVWGWQLTVFLVVTFAVGAHMTDISFSELFDEDGFQGASRIFQSFLNPEWNLLPRAVAAIIETIFMAFMATALAIPIAFVLCFLAAKNIMKHPAAFVVYFLLRLILNIFRSIEAIVWAIIFSVWVGIGPFAGMLALMIHSVVSLAKQYSELVETVADGPIEGIQSTGAGRLQTIWFAIVPQVILPFISYTIYRWDINIRMATIVGFVGGGGIGTLLFLYQQQGKWAEVGTIALVIAFVVWFMDTASAYLREALK